MHPDHCLSCDWSIRLKSGAAQPKNKKEAEAEEQKKPKRGHQCCKSNDEATDDEPKKKAGRQRGEKSGDGKSKDDAVDESLLKDSNRLKGSGKRRWLIGSLPTGKVEGIVAVLTQPGRSYFGSRLQSRL